MKDDLNNGAMVHLPAAELLQVVNRVLPVSGLFAAEAQLVADEIRRLRDTGNLSENVAGNIKSMICQQSVHAERSGDQMTSAMGRLRRELDRHKRGALPSSQVDPVAVNARIAEIAANIPLALPAEPANGCETAKRVVSGIAVRADGSIYAPQPRVASAAEIEAELARILRNSVSPGWESLRYRVDTVGLSSTDVIYTQRSGQEDRHFPLFEAVDVINALKAARYIPGEGTWISLTMTLGVSGGVCVDFSYNEEPMPNFGAVADEEYMLELQMFPRDPECIPSWWADRLKPTLARTNNASTNTTQRARLEREILRSIEDSIAPGWTSLCLQVDFVGTVMSWLIYVDRQGAQETVLPPVAAYKLLKELKSIQYLEGKGTWLSSSMRLTPDGGCVTDYRYNAEPAFAVFNEDTTLSTTISGEEYEVELQKYPRPSTSLPGWWARKLNL